jgi:hypothetical protein
MNGNGNNNGGGNNTNGNGFPYENTCVMAGQVCPKNQNKPAIEWKDGRDGAQGRLIVSVKMKRQWNNRATGQVEKRISFVRLVAYGDQGRWLQNNLQPGMYIKFKAEFRLSWFKDTQSGQFKPLIEFALGKPLNGEQLVFSLGGGPIEFEESTNKQQYQNNGGGNNGGGGNGGFNGGNNAGGGNGFNNNGGGGFNGGNQPAGGFNNHQANNGGSTATAAPRSRAPVAAASAKATVASSRPLAASAGTPPAASRTTAATVRAAASRAPRCRSRARTTASTTAVSSRPRRRKGTGTVGAATAPAAFRTPTSRSSPHDQPAEPRGFNSPEVRAAVEKFLNLLRCGKI